MLYIFPLSFLTLLFRLYTANTCRFCEIIFREWTQTNCLGCKIFLTRHIPFHQAISFSLDLLDELQCISWSTNASSLDFLWLSRPSIVGSIIFAVLSDTMCQNCSDNYIDEP
jgi:hypothetical protein